MHWSGTVVSQTSPSFSYPNDILGRHCTVDVSGLHRRTGYARDSATGISVRSSGWKSRNGAKKHALEELCKKLHGHFAPQRAREAAERKAREDAARRAREDAARRAREDVARKAREAAERRAREERERIERERRAREAEIRRLQQQLAEEQRRHARQLRQKRAEQKTQLENRKKWLTTQLTEKRQEYNLKHAEFVNLMQQIYREEKEIEDFKAERNDEGTKLIITLGHTGDGKSTFCNRLSGDKSMFGDEGPFKASGDGASCTQKHSKSIIVMNNNKITVVDTPGFSDSFGRDRDHGNKLCKYLKGCGGINNFILIRNSTNVRFDDGFQKMLQQYYKMFGDVFFKLLIIVATRIDSRINKLQFERNNQTLSLQQDICKRFDLNMNIPVIPIGLESYEESIQALINVISDDKFECKHIKSPIDELKARGMILKNQDNGLKQQVDRIRNELNVVNQSINSL